MCAIVGAFNIPNIYGNIFKMMRGLSHRGENGAGAVFDMGGDVPVWERTEFTIPELARKIAGPDFSKSSAAVGHVRYGTAGERRSLNEAQPLMARMRNERLVYLAHNGDSPYMEEDRQELVNRGSVFSTNSDSEIMLHRIALSASDDPITAIKEGLREYRGTY